MQVTFQDLCETLVAICQPFPGLQFMMKGEREILTSHLKNLQQNNGLVKFLEILE